MERIKLKCLQHQEMIKRTREREREEKQIKILSFIFYFSFVCLVRVKSGVNECDMNRSTTLQTALIAGGSISVALDRIISQASLGF